MCFLQLGTSSLSLPIMFTTAGQETGAAAAPVAGSSTATAVGLALACILVAAIVAAAALYYRHRKVRWVEYTKGRPDTKKIIYFHIKRCHYYCKSCTQARIGRSRL